jgi:PPOX class probable F420-dependent enzyme
MCPKKRALLAETGTLDAAPGACPGNTPPGGTVVEETTPMKEKRMTKRWNDVRPYFERDTVVHVATLLPDGAPHSVPVWIGVEGDRLTMFTMADSRKDRDLQTDPRLAVSVTNPANPLDSAFVRGRVVERVTGDEALPIVDRISEKYTGAPYDIRSGLTAFYIEPEVSWARDYSEE